MRPDYILQASHALVSIFFIIYLWFVRAETERKKSNWSVKDISMGATLAVSGFLLSNWKLLFSFSIQARDLTFNEVSLRFNSISPSTLPTQKIKQIVLLPAAAFQVSKKVKPGQTKPKNNKIKVFALLATWNPSHARRSIHYSNTKLQVPTII